MADAKMNAVWWKKNKAMTLLDKGDTVLNALKVWDKAKAKDDVRDIQEALRDLAKASEDLKDKANKTLHKETIAYLNTYIENCKQGFANLKKSNGEGLMKNLANVPKSIMEDLKALNKMFWIRYEENLLFLAAMKGGKGSPKILAEYIVVGADHQVNISTTQRKAVEAEAEAGDWSGDAWQAAVKEIRTMVKSNESQGGLEDCARVERQMQIEALRRM